MIFLNMEDKMPNSFKKYCLLFTFFPLVFVIFLTACNSSSNEVASEPLSRTEFLLGTVVKITLYDQQSEETLDLAMNKLKELEDTLSINKTGTLIDQINASSGITPVVVDADTYKVIEEGLTYSSLTNGAFDITIGPIVKLWNIGFPEARIPSSEEIESTLPLVDFNKVVLNPNDSSVYLTDKGMQLDLGGIGKGYAADEVATLLKEKGVTHAIIDLGGNIYALGDKPGNQLWTIGVQDPFNPRGKIIGRLKTADKSVVTSGVYERFVEDEAGNKYHHILNPKTGYPYENQIAGVTIISNSSTDGDALSTAVFAMGVKEGIAFVETLDGVDAIFITLDSKVYTTSGVKDNFTLSNDSFTLAN